MKDLSSCLCFSGLSRSLVCVDVPVDALFGQRGDASCLSLAELVGVVAEPLTQLVVKLALRLRTTLGVRALLVDARPLALQLCARALPSTVHRRLPRLLGVGGTTLPADLSRQHLPLPARQHHHHHHKLY